MHKQQFVLPNSYDIEGSVGTNEQFTGEGQLGEKTQKTWLKQYAGTKDNFFLKPSSLGRLRTEIFHQIYFLIL